MFLRTGAINVTTATRQGETSMATFTIDTENNIVAHAEAPDKTPEN
jgi:hypothetical protein